MQPLPAEGCVVPTRLKIDCAKKEARGLYELVPGVSWLGKPVWDQDTKARQRIYSDKDGRWIVGTAAVMKENAGWLISSEHGDVLMPDEIEEWLHYNAQGEWVPTGLSVVPEGSSPWPLPAADARMACADRGCTSRSPGEWKCKECMRLFCISCKFSHDCYPQPPALQQHQHQQPQPQLQQPQQPAPYALSSFSGRVSRSVPIAQHRSPSPPRLAVSPAASPTLSFAPSPDDGGPSAAAAASGPSAAEAAAEAARQQEQQKELTRLRAAVETMDERRRDDAKAMATLQRRLDATTAEAASLESRLSTSDTIAAALRDQRDAAWAEAHAAEAEAAAEAAAAEAAKAAAAAAATAPVPSGTVDDPLWGSVFVDPHAAEDHAEVSPSRSRQLRRQASAVALEDRRLQVTKACAGPACTVMTSIPVAVGAAVAGGAQLIHFEVKQMKGGRGSRMCVGVAGRSGAPRVDLRGDGLVFVNGDLYSDSYASTTSVAAAAAADITGLVSSPGFEGGGVEHLSYARGDVVTVCVDPAAGTVAFSVNDPSAAHPVVVVPLPLPTRWATGDGGAEEEYYEERAQEYFPCVRLVSQGDSARVAHDAADVVAKAALSNRVGELEDTLCLMENRFVAGTEERARTAPPQLRASECHWARAREEAAAPSPLPSQEEQPWRLDVTADPDPESPAVPLPVEEVRLTVVEWHSARPCAAPPAPARPETRDFTGGPVGPPQRSRGVGTAEGHGGVVPASPRRVVTPFSKRNEQAADHNGGGLGLEAAASSSVAAAARVVVPPPVLLPPPPPPPAEHVRCLENAVCMLASMECDDWEAAAAVLSRCFDTGGAGEGEAAAVRSLTEAGCLVIDKMQQKTSALRAMYAEVQTVATRAMEAAEAAEGEAAMEREAAAEAVAAAAEAAAAAAQLAVERSEPPRTDQGTQPSPRPSPPRSGGGEAAVVSMDEAAIGVGEDAAEVFLADAATSPLAASAAAAGKGSPSASAAVRGGAPDWLAAAGPLVPALDRVLCAVSEGASLPPEIFSDEHILYSLVPVLSRIHTNIALSKLTSPQPQPTPQVRAQAEASVTVTSVPLPAAPAPPLPPRRAFSAEGSSPPAADAEPSRRRSIVDELEKVEQSLAMHAAALYPEGASASAAARSSSAAATSASVPEWVTADPWSAKLCGTLPPLPVMPPPLASPAPSGVASRMRNVSPPRRVGRVVRMENE